MLPVRSISPKPKIPEKRPSWEVADIFREYGKDFRIQHPLPLFQKKVMHAIEVCRTSHLGGHLERCDACGYEKPSYNSCRNRHCPKCQALTKSRWLQARKEELLPVGYFHNVFTLPHEINPIALCNQKVVLDILFKAASETLITYGENPKNGLGGKLGFIAVLKAEEFIRRFLLHVLPNGFVRIRHFGFLANRCKKQNLKRCRKFFNMPEKQSGTQDPTWQEWMLESTGMDITQCPCCKQGKMQMVGEIPRIHEPHYLDSS